jgi:hypothetical protein
VQPTRIPAYAGGLHPPYDIHGSTHATGIRRTKTRDDHATRSKAGRINIPLVVMDVLPHLGLVKAHRADRVSHRSEV